MKKTWAMICVLGTLGPGAVVVLAQAPVAAAPDPQARSAQLAQDLSLADAQKPRFQQILDAQRSALMASMKQEREQNTDLATTHQNHQKIEDAAMARLKPIRSDE